MTRDYARTQYSRSKARNTRIQPSRNTAPGWVWLVAGILIGGVGMKLYDLGNTPAPDSEIAVVPTEKPSDTQPPPRFDFYTLLTESEEVIPDVPLAPTGEATKPEQVKTPEDKTAVSQQAEDVATVKPPVATTTDNTAVTAAASPREVYVLQVGAFRSSNDADSLRARLILLNMQAMVETVTPKPGETWHRVLVGPFPTTQLLGNARRILQQNGIDSIQVKRRL